MSVRRSEQDHKKQKNIIVWMLKRKYNGNKVQNIIDTKNERERERERERGRNTEWQ